MIHRGHAGLYGHGRDQQPQLHDGRRGLSAAGGGVFQVASSLGLNGVIDGNGSLTKTGSGDV